MTAVALSSPATRLFAEDEYKVYTAPPRLLLKPQRLRLLRRERERQSQRWQQLDALIAGKAQMAEPGFAFALHHKVTEDRGSARQAIQWAALPASVDTRQLALVYDWCRDLLSAAEKTQLESKLLRQDAVKDVTTARDRVFAAIAIADAAPEASAKALGQILKQWWKTSVAPTLNSGQRVLSSVEAYALLELMHAIRDNLQIELRDDALAFFRDLPASRMLSYYPARYPAPENEFRIPFYSGKGDPDLRAAALSRAADMSFVAYDNNVVESQFIQGWVSNDAFQLRSTHGSPYEFLWANPYQPGLSYHHMPLRFYDKRAGRLFVRSSWDEDASWAAFVDGRLQIFQDGKIQAAAAGTVDKPEVIGEVAIVAGAPTIRWRLKADQPSDWFIVRLKPHQPFDIEVDDEELAEVFTDGGGILALTFPRRDRVGVRLRERTAASATLK